MILEHPHIKVREIYEEGNILAYAGRNSFKLMYLNKKVNFYQDEQLDKVIFKDGLFISTNENMLKIGNYKIIPPYTICYTASEKYLGRHDLVFKTYAECNETYFKEKNVDISAIGSYGADDVCVYTVYRTINFWEKGEVRMIPIIISLVVLVAAVVTIIVVISVKSKKVKMV